MNPNNSNMFSFLKSSVLFFGFGIIRPVRAARHLMENFSTSTDRQRFIFTGKISSAVVCMSFLIAIPVFWLSGVGFRHSDILIPVIIVGVMLISAVTFHGVFRLHRVTSDLSTTVALFTMIFGGFYVLRSLVAYPFNLGLVEQITALGEVYGAELSISDVVALVLESSIMPSTDVIQNVHAIDRIVVEGVVLALLSFYQFLLFVVLIHVVQKLYSIPVFQSFRIGLLGFCVLEIVALLGNFSQWITMYIFA